jgi:hypothetical protein
MMTVTFVVLVANLYARARWPMVDPVRGISLVREAGLSAEVLAAAGCSASDVNAIAVDIRGNTEVRTTRSQTLASISNIDQQLAEVAHRLSTNPRDGDAHRQELSLRQSRQSTMQALLDAEHALRAHATAGLSEDVVAKVESGAKSRGHMIPVPIRVAMPADSDWKLVAATVRAQARSARMGTELPPQMQDMAQAVSRNGSIAAATEHLQANVVAIRSELAAVIQ